MIRFRNLTGAATIALAAALPALADTPVDILVVAQNIDDIVTMDPASAYEFSSGEYVTNTYETLVKYKAEDTTALAPALASDWQADAGARAITFTLRDDVRFSSGNPLRPEDVIASWERVVKLDKAPAFILTQLGWTPDNIRQMVTAQGNQLTVRYEGDVSPDFVLNVLAARPASVVDVTTAMANEKDGDLGHDWLNRSSAGTGPFMLRDFRPAEMLALSANPEYRGPAPAMAQVIIRHIAEPATQRVLLEAGDVDMARNLMPDQIAGLAGKDGIRVETYPQAAIHWISLNQKVPALTDPAIWQAARYLVDYQGMADSFLKGQMQVHQSFWPTGFPAALADTPYSYDPDKAK